MILFMFKCVWKWEQSPVPAELSQPTSHTDYQHSRHRRPTQRGVRRSDDGGNFSHTQTDTIPQHQTNRQWCSFEKKKEKKPNRWKRRENVNTNRVKETHTCPKWLSQPSDRNYDIRWHSALPTGAATNLLLMRQLTFSRHRRSDAAQFQQIQQITPFYWKFIDCKLFFFTDFPSPLWYVIFWQYCTVSHLWTHALHQTLTVSPEHMGLILK